MQRTIIVSNRLPYRFHINNGTVMKKPSEGGLATGLQHLCSKEHCYWIGWPGVVTENEGVRQRIRNLLVPQRILPVFLNQEEVDTFYNGFSNESLWPIAHYFPSISHFNEAHWKSYRLVNERFAEMVLHTATEEDVIWIHDYQLMLVPALIRSRLPKARIAYFHHIPFPSKHLFDILPWKKELIQGILGADLIGFHTESDKKNFMETAEPCHLATMSRLSSVIEVLPMGIDAGKYASLAEQSQTVRKAGKLKMLLKHRKIVLSIDRLDYSKGILHRLAAVEAYLRKYPEEREQVVFVQVVVPSREEVPQYNSLKDEINAKVGAINALYGTIDWQPLCYMYRSFPVEMLSALYVVADVAMVTPLRDGMNLVCKEFVASRIKQDGVLILSAFAGAASALKEAIIVNPFHEKEVVAAIHAGVHMPLREQKRRMALLQRYVTGNDIYKWVRNNMNSLERVALPVDSELSL